MGGGGGGRGAQGWGGSVWPRKENCFVAAADANAACDLLL